MRKSLNQYSHENSLTEKKITSELNHLTYLHSKLEID